MPFNGYEAADLPNRIGCMEAYARLFKIWANMIVEHGPPTNTQIGIFSLSSPPTSVWDVFAIAPKSQRAELFVRSVMDAIDDRMQNVIFDPVMVVAKCEAELWWIDVVNYGHFRNRQRLVQDAAHYIATLKGSQIGGMGST